MLNRNNLKTAIMNIRLSKFSLLLLVGMMSCITLFAQKTITGVVIHPETQDALQGVTISVKGSNKNTVSGSQGEFKITVPSDQTILVFSSIGFVRKELVVGDKTFLSVTLLRDNKQLEDVVIQVGYGSKKKTNVLGAVATIKAQDIEDLPVTNLGQALVGRVPGVSVSTTSGKPGATTSINIRNPTLFAASGRLGLTSPTNTFDT